MKTPYLIQRAKKQKREGKKGIDSLVSFDYMGSSEFEWGALPKSLKRFRENQKEYIDIQYSFKKFPSKVVNVVCKKKDQDQVCEYLEQLVKNELQLKEFCDLHAWVNPNENAYNPSDLWWDIDNDFFFWKFEDPVFDINFKTALFSK